VSAHTVARRRGQSGVTLVELLIALLLATMLIVPLVAWGTFALRHKPVARDGLVRVAGSALLFHHFPKDVATAGGAAIDEEMAEQVELAWNFEDCIGGAASSDVVLVLLRGGPEPSKIVYSETASPTEPGAGVLHRRECDAQDGTGTEESELIEAVQRGSTTVTCSDADELVPCKHIELRTTPVASGEEIVLAATRRVDMVAVQHLVSDNRVPIARIEVESQALVPGPGGGYPVVLSSAPSRDPDGQIVCYQWVFPTAAWGSGPAAEPDRVTIEVPPEPEEGAPEPDPDHTWCPEDAAPPIVQADRDDPTFHLHQRVLPTPGVYYVELTVTDDKGHSSTNYKRIEVVQPDPVAAARAEIVAGGGTPGGTVIELAARWIDEDTGVETGSHHPDGTIVSYEWAVVAAHGGPESAFYAVREGPGPWYVALPEWIQGTVLVRLTVTDSEGRTAHAPASVELGWDPPLPLEPDGEWTPPVRVDPPPPPTGGAHEPPVDLRFAARTSATAMDLWQVLEWTGPAVLDRYRVEYRHRGPGCDVTHVRLLDPSPTPSALLHPSLCPRHASAVSEVRVGAELEDRIGWSDWVTYDPGAWRTDPNILEPDEGD